MSKRRRLTAVLTFAAASFAAADAPACFLTDWLYGRQPAYVAGYAPYPVASPYAVNYGYAANYGAAPVAYAAGYAPASPMVAAYPPASPLYSAAYGATPLTPSATPRYQISGVYQAQQPAYAYNNPSVYTGMPVASPATAQTSYSLPLNSTPTPIATAYPPATLPTATIPIPNGGIPLAQRLRGNAPTSSFYGGGNTYPMQPSASQSYSAGYAVPATAMPATQTAPLYVVPTQPRVGGLGRFFSSLFGTNYQTSYYRAPVTYYRPVTSIDPVSGTTVTTQRACTSYLDQLQRSPYSSLGANQPSVYSPTPIGQPVPAGAPADTSPLSPPSLSGGQFAPAYGQPPAYGSVTSQSPPSPIGNVNQAGATVDPNRQFTIPIPSTTMDPYASSNGNSSSAPPSAGYAPSNLVPNGYTPNTEPLSGAPSPEGNDRAPLDPPRLESARPSQTDTQDRYPSDIDRYLDDHRDNTSPSAGEPAKSKMQWQLQNPADSSVFGSNSTEASDRMITANEKSEQSNLGYSSAHPIQAPPNYVSPFRRQTLEVQPQPTEREQPLTAPPLPPSSEQPINASNRERSRYAIPLREAALVRERTRESEMLPPVNRTYQPVSRQSETRTPAKRKRQESGWGAITP
ncbi:hypothetical protein Pla52o_47550 [Novipirellula galeiformis]|uniref:Uncharacterized protein n=1 Tax=Novipirellula galeiformis TaxID=2528004 RepID=A0A5C6C6I2_9BACT|nr:hypothetical protein [Novipirellula galeiformis]TWU20240.1 hypothetical protein Pla52o_47550 [Novipirellula galeiformis]